MPEKGFSVIFVSNTGKAPHQIKVNGWKLYLARVLMAMIVVLLLSAVIIVAYGLLNVGETDKLRSEILQLQDSLAIRRNVEVRLESLELEIQQLREYRQRLENIAAGIPVQVDSLEQ